MIFLNNYTAAYFYNFFD